MMECSTPFYIISMVMWNTYIFSFSFQEFSSLILVLFLKLSFSLSFRMKYRWLSSCSFCAGWNRSLWKHFTNVITHYRYIVVVIYWWRYNIAPEKNVRNNNVLQFKQQHDCNNVYTCVEWWNTNYWKQYFYLLELR